MIRQRKNKKGFTLVEMVLSLAIIVLIGGVIAGLCASISNSFVTTYNIDDAADYAMLYAKGFENSFLSYTQSTGSAGDTWSWTIDSSTGNVPLLKYTLPDGTTGAAFNPKMVNPSSSTDPKWSVYMFYKFDDSKALVSYKIFLKDNFNKTAYVYMYEGSFWVPQFEKRAEFAGVKDSRSVSVSGLPMQQSTFTSYGFSSEEWNQVKNFMDPEYKTVIKYKWG